VIRNSFTSTKPRAILFVVIFSVMGVVALLLTRAAVPTHSVATEAEFGSLSGGATVVTGDSSALNGSYVRFGNPAAPDSYRVLRVFASEQESSQATSAQEQEQAEHLVSITTNGNRYNIAQIHSWASDGASINGGQITVLKYINGSHVTGCAAARGSGLAAADREGSYLFHKGTDNFLMDIGKPGWQNDRATAASAIVTGANAFDGVWFDTLGPDVIGNGYNSAIGTDCSSPVTDTKTVPYHNGQYYDDTSWGAAAGALLQTVKRQLPATKVIAFNGSRTASDPAWQGGSVGMHENWLGILSTTDYPTVEKWLHDLGELVDVANAGKILQVYVKPCFGNGYQTGCTGPVDATGHGAAMNAVHLFALSTFLLGTDGNQQFEFRYNKGPTLWDPYWDRLLIGRPSGGYKQASEVYYRQFTHGFVAVNPSPSAVTVSLPFLNGRYTSLDNGSSKSYSGTLSITANSGVVLMSNF